MDNIIINILIPIGLVLGVTFLMYISAKIIMKIKDLNYKCKLQREKEDE